MNPDPHASPLPHPQTAQPPLYTLPPASALQPDPPLSPGAPLSRHPWLRALALALLCGALQAGLPRYALGAAALAPLSMVLGVVVAAVLARGRWMLVPALLGMLCGDLLNHTAPVAAALACSVLGLQALTADSLMRAAHDHGLLQLDSWPRLSRLVLLAAPAAALLGVLLGGLTQWGLDAAALPALRPPLAAALGRFVADAAGIIVTAPVLLCWLARPQKPWRPRRRQVALPLLLLTLAMLPGFDQVARRDEIRLQTSFERDASHRRLRIQQLLTDPLDAALALGGVVAAGAPGLPMVLFDRVSAAWMDRVAGLQVTGWVERVAPATAAATASTPQPARAGARPEPSAWTLGHVHGGPADLRVLPGAQAGMGGQLDPSLGLQQALDRAAGSDRALVLLAQDEPGIGPLAGAKTALGSPATPNGDAADSRLLLLQSTPATAVTALGSAPISSATAAATAQSATAQFATPKRLVFLVIDTARLLLPALPDNDDPNLRVCLTDAHTEPGRTTVQRLAGPLGCETDSSVTAVRRQLGRVSLGERRLDLLITEPNTADNRLFTAVWLLALPAVLGAALLSSLLLALTGRLRRIEDRVRERTVALQTEIDERRHTEDALAASEQRFRAIFDSVSIGVTVVNRQGQLVDVNPAFCTMMACTAAELLGRPLAEFQLPDVLGEDGTALAVGGALAHRQRYLTPDGRVLQVAANLRTLHDASGQPVATVGALQDLTQVLRLREAEREREAAEIANRTKSEFLANLSHEFRAPLNAIVGFAQMLGDNDHAPGDGNTPRSDPLGQQHGLAKIRQAGWHLLDMVNDVLDLSRMEAGSLRLTLEPVSLADLAQEAMQMVEPAARQAGVTLSLSLSPQADRAQADPLRLRQVLINLLSNAVKYNRHGGHVTLRTRPGAAGELTIEVEDTGIGLSESQIGALFTPFNRLGRERLGAGSGAPGSQGTGIGLVICRKLSQLMGGELTVSSHQGEGSVFSLRLPRASGETSRVEVNTGALLGAGVVIGSVLYIEDSLADQQAVQQALKARPGIKLHCVSTAAEGLALVTEHDLVLLDLDLPDSPGLELLRNLAADSRFRHTPVIVVSAESRPQRIDDCFDAGAAQFLTKPIDAQQLLRTLDACLG